MRGLTEREAFILRASSDETPECDSCGGDFRACACAISDGLVSEAEERSLIARGYLAWSDWKPTGVGYGVYQELVTTGRGRLALRLHDAVQAVHAPLEERAP